MSVASCPRRREKCDNWLKSGLTARQSALRMLSHAFIVPGVLVIWVVVFVIVVAVMFFFRPKKPAPAASTLRQTTHDAKIRMANLLVDEQAHSASQIRKTAAENYDKIRAAAIASGKDEAFAHQVGVQQALTAVSSPGRQPVGTDHMNLQMETAPFNKLDPIKGRAAIIEYCVWKFFPGQADEGAFASALCRFRDKVLEDATDDGEVFSLLYNMKHDWQRWLSDHRDCDVAQ